MLAYYMPMHFVFDVLLSFLLVITYVSFVSSWSFNETSGIFDHISGCTLMNYLPYNMTPIYMFNNLHMFSVTTVSTHRYRACYHESIVTNDISHHRLMNVLLVTMHPFTNCVFSCSWFLMKKQNFYAALVFHVLIIIIKTCYLLYLLSNGVLVDVGDLVSLYCLAGRPVLSIFLFFYDKCL